MSLGIILVKDEDFQVKDFKDTIELVYNSTYQEDIGNVCYGNKDKCVDVDEVCKEGFVDTTKVGEYKISYTYKYKDKSLTKEQIIKVIDNVKPVIEIEDSSLKACPKEKDLKFKVKAYDEYDGNLTDQVIETINDDKVTFKVSDKSGNVYEVTKDINYSDTGAPKITLKGDATVYVVVNGTYKEQGAEATDDCDGDISSKIEISGKVDTSTVGTYKITYKVKDSSNNSKSVTRTVKVYQKNNSSNNNNTSKVIYLTFDDGPGPYTNQLLDILKKYNVKATFFVTNQGITKGYDDVILRAYKEGHTIGLHSMTHNYSIYRSSETYFEDLYAIQKKVKRITGYTSTIIRFPGGSSNTVSRSYDNGTKIMSKLTKEVEEKGFKYFDWNVSSGDAGQTTSSKQVYKNIINSLGSKSSYVVLQHDIKKYSVDAVEDVIIYGLANGYTFKPLTMDSPTAHHHLNN